MEDMNTGETRGKTLHSSRDNEFAAFDSLSPAEQGVVIGAPYQFNCMAIHEALEGVHPSQRLRYLKRSLAASCRSVARADLPPGHPCRERLSDGARAEGWS